MLEFLKNQAVVDFSGGTSSPVSPGPSSPAQVLGSSNNNAIQSIGAGLIDTAFLDALYAGGKLSPAQRDAILSAADPSGFGLSQYDLYCLTVGRLGMRYATMSALGLVTVWSATATYLPGQLVIWTPPGSVQPGLYQSQAAVPAGTPPSNATYWLQLAAPQGVGAVSVYSSTVAYQPGQLVIFQPAAGQVYGLYLCQVAGSAGTLPTVTANWLQVTSPGPVVLYDADVLNPTMPLISAVSGSVGIQTSLGSALPGIQLPAGRRYRVTTGNPRPVTAGSSTPGDSTVIVTAQLGESTGQDLSGNSVYTLIVVPRWQQQGLAPNTAVAAVTAGTLASRLRIELI